MGRASPFHETDGDYRTEKFMEGGSSVLPLYSLQDSLPQLPLPTLEETFARYLVSIEPLADQEEYKATAAAAREFLRPGGLVRGGFQCCRLSRCCCYPAAHRRDLLNSANNYSEHFLFGQN